MITLTELFGNVSLLTFFLLLLAGLLAGYIDTLVGGGGLITIPALLAAGVPPIAALGTNKLQACAGTGAASLTLVLGKKIVVGKVKWLMLSAFIGALLGAMVVQFINAASLELLIPIVIGGILIYFLISPKPTNEQRPAKLSLSHYRASAVPAVGFYDGMFGPATGSFFVLTGVGLRGETIVDATMTAKTLNFATNIASLLVFIWFGNVVFVLGLVMMVGQFVGASFGARALMNINPNALRGLVVVMCVIMLCVWLFKV